MQMKDFTTASRCQKKALELAPDQVDAVVNLALAYDMNGEREKALEEYKQALAKTPRCRPDFQYGPPVFHSGDYDEAVGLFQKVIAQNPDDYDANVNVGNSFLNMAEEVRKALIEKEKNKQTVSDDEMATAQWFITRTHPLSGEGAWASKGTIAPSGTTWALPTSTSAMRPREKSA
jgi:tetratricopeptide (TPR) repeat protein